MDTAEGPRAVLQKSWQTQAEPVRSNTVQRYLNKAFGSAYLHVKHAMLGLAEAFENPEQLDQQAYSLYTQFRPAVEEGRRGWGAKGRLELDKIRALATRVSRQAASHSVQ